MSFVITAFFVCKDLLEVGTSFGGKFMSFCLQCVKWCKQSKLIDIFFCINLFSSSKSKSQDSDWESTSEHDQIPVISEENEDDLDLNEDSFLEDVDFDASEITKKVNIDDQA